LQFFLQGGSKINLNLLRQKEKFITLTGKTK